VNVKCDKTLESTNLNMKNNTKTRTHSC